MTDIRLTPVEAQVHGQMLSEHRAHKCGRCDGRNDLKDGRVQCMRGEDAEEVQQGDRLCRKFRLDEDQSRWLG